MPGSSASPDPIDRPDPSSMPAPYMGMPGPLGRPNPSGLPVPEGIPNGDDPDLPPLQNEDFLPPVNRWVTLGGMVMAGTLIGVIGLASVLKYNATVEASASVRPEGELSILQSAVDGTVSAIKVQPNQVVHQGDVIVEIMAFDRNRLRVLQARKNLLEGYISQYRAKLSAINSQLQSLNGQILAKARVTPPPAIGPAQNNAQPNSEALVNSALETLGKAGANFSNQRDRLLQQRTALEKQIQYDGDTLQEVNAEIGKQIVRAPADGTLLKLDVNNAGQPVKVGDSIAQIVPQNAPLVVKGQVQTQDISKVQTGQTVQMRVTAYPYPDYGVLQGKVQAVAPDVTTVREGNGSGLSYYEVTIKPDQPYLSRDNRQYYLQPGMEVRADIISRQETLLQFLLRKARLWTDL